MAVDTSNFLRCTYGTSALSLIGYSVKADPVVKSGIGRVFTQVQITAECELRRSGSAADYATALANAIKDLGTDGRDFIVYGLGGVVEYQLLAATCQDGGPQIGFELSDGDAPLCKKFRIAIKTSQSSSGSTPVDSFTVKTATRADGLRTVTRGGTVHGLKSSDYYLKNILPAVAKAYALPRWVLTDEWTATQDVNHSQVSYSIACVETRGVPSVDTGNYAVDGEITQAVSRDEQYRLQTTFSLNLLVKGDPQKLLSQVRDEATAKGKKIALKENWSITRVHETRLIGSITTLASADAKNKWLLNFTETVELRGQDAGWEIRTYPGADPVVFQRPHTICTVRISGSVTTCNGKFWKPISARYGKNLEPPQVITTRVNDLELRTDFHFVCFPVSGKGAVPDASADWDKFRLGDILRSRASIDNSFY